MEVKEGRYFLNGEPMRLMGVEWMPGSDPRYGMAESPEFMRSVLRDMKALNCLITRFHWQQDDSVFEFMDREGNADTGRNSLLGRQKPWKAI